MLEPDHKVRVEWLAKQMYSRKAPIGRDQIFQAYAAVLTAISGVAVESADKVAEEDIPHMERLGYWAARQTWRLNAGDAALRCAIDPVLASMGVSGERHSWRSEGLPEGFEVSGSALSSGRQPGFAEIQIVSPDNAHSSRLGELFVDSFPPRLDEASLSEEIEAMLREQEDG